MLTANSSSHCSVPACHRANSHHMAITELVKSIAHRLSPFPGVIWTLVRNVDSSGPTPNRVRTHSSVSSQVEYQEGPEVLF